VIETGKISTRSAFDVIDVKFLIRDDRTAPSEVNVNFYLLAISKNKLIEITPVRTPLL